MKPTDEQVEAAKKLYHLTFGVFDDKAISMMAEILAARDQEKDCVIAALRARNETQNGREEGVKELRAALPMLLNAAMCVAMHLWVLHGHDFVLGTCAGGSVVMALMDAKRAGRRG